MIMARKLDRILMIVFAAVGREQQDHRGKAAGRGSDEFDAM